MMTDVAVVEEKISHSMLWF